MLISYVKIEEKERCNLIFEIVIFEMVHVHYREINGLFAALAKKPWFKPGFLIIDSFSYRNQPLFL